MSPCKPYKRDPLVSALWRHFRAVPVLPILTDLAPLKVLRKDVDGFRIVGDLATTCCVGQKKKELQKIISKHSSKYLLRKPVKIGDSHTTVNGHQKAALRMLVQGQGAESFWERFQSMEIKVEGHQEWKPASTERWDELLEGWKPDPENKRLGWNDRKGEVELWVVELVIEAQSIQLRGVGKKDRLALGWSTSMAPVGAGVEVTNSSEGHYVLRSENKHKYLPIAFRGIRLKFNKQGARLRSEPARLLSDSEPAVGTTSVEETSPPTDQSVVEHEDVEGDTPFDCMHMAPFVEDDWFATILPEEPQPEEDEGEAEDDHDDEGELEQERNDADVSLSGSP